MLGVDKVGTKEANLMMVSMLSDDVQKQIYQYLTENYYNDNSVYKSKSAEAIFSNKMKWK